ncbi:O-acyltransferase like protein-like [Condylostylus longicornis]|uniref:O-acyltransferase like protein-like n=1 Tax=Condylostylus longicornis TaxID=2530218 RepID=UPI00244DA44C|nr:O-acyltransferase like protein-like [Condylostylus longicornis]
MILEIPSKDFMNCDLHKWKNILFIDTFFPMEERCMIWSWLISLEVQFFLAGSLILLLAQIHPKYAASIFFTLLIFSIIAFLMLESDPFSLYYERESQQKICLKLNLLFDNIWLRILPYLLGMCLGYTIQKTGGKFKSSKTVMVFGWMLCILIIGVYFFGLPLIIGRINLWVRASAITMLHIAWNMILCWITLSSLSDYGGLLKDFLNSKLLFTIGKFTNTVILLNPLIIRTVLLSGETGILLSGGLVIMMFIGFTITTYIFAFILHIFFEAPLLSTLRVVYQWQIK